MFFLFFFPEKDFISLATDWSQTLSLHFWLCSNVYCLVEQMWNVQWFFQICTALPNFNQPFRLVFSLKLLLIPALPPIIFYLSAKAFEKDQLLCSLAVISSVSAQELSDLGLSVEREQICCEGWVLATYPSKGSLSNLADVFISGENNISAQTGQA